MASSLPIAVAEAVIALINTAPAGTFTPGMTAVRHYRPQFDLAELKTLRVSVVPKGIEIATLGRRVNQHDISVDVAVQQKVDTADQDALDALMALVQQIADFLRLQRIALSDGSSAMWIKTQNLPIYSPEHLEQHQTFTSVLTVTYRVVQ